MSPLAVAVEDSAGPPRFTLPDQRRRRRFRLRQGCSTTCRWGRMRRQQDALTHRFSCPAATSVRITAAPDGRDPGGRRLRGDRRAAPERYPFREARAPHLLRDRCTFCSTAPGPCRSEKEIDATPRSAAEGHRRKDPCVQSNRSDSGRQGGGGVEIPFSRRFLGSPFSGACPDLHLAGHFGEAAPLRLPRHMRTSTGLASSWRVDQQSARGPVADVCFL